MFFEFEPTGAADACLQLRRNSGRITVHPAGVWNGFLRVDHPPVDPTKEEPYLIFKVADIGYHRDHFVWRGRASAFAASPAMLALLVGRNMASRDDADRLTHGLPPEDTGWSTDRDLMLRALLHGASFAPISVDGRLQGFALRTLSDSETFVLGLEAGLPSLDSAAREALSRLLKAASPS